MLLQRWLYWGCIPTGLPATNWASYPATSCESAAYKDYCNGTCCKYINPPEVIFFFRSQPTPQVYTITHPPLVYSLFITILLFVVAWKSHNSLKKEKGVGNRSTEYGEANVAGGCCEGAGGKGEGLGWLLEHIFSLLLQLNKVGLWLVQRREQRKRHPWIPMEGPDWALLLDNAWVYCWNLLTLLHGKPWELQSGGNFSSFSFSRSLFLSPLGARKPSRSSEYSWSCTTPPW